MLILLVAVVAGAAYTALNFAMNTDSSTLISPDLPWRKTMARFDALFPQRNNLILVVIDAASPDRANTAANMLAAKLAADSKQFPAVRRPDGGPYFDEYKDCHYAEEWFAEFDAVTRPRPARPA